MEAISKAGHEKCCLLVTNSRGGKMWQAKSSDEMGDRGERG